MFFEAVINDGRRLAESLMVDACVITGPGTNPVWDETTGTYTYTPGAVLYSGRCKRQSFTRRMEQTASSGDHVFVESRDSLHIPMSAPHITGGSVAVMTACPLDPGSVGIRLHVDGPGGKTWPTAQRLNVTEVVG